MTLILTVIAIALVFEYINGFHDTANSIATVVSTKVLTPRQAVMLAAVASEPEKASERHRAYLQLGARLAAEQATVKSREYQQWQPAKQRNEYDPAAYKLERVIGQVLDGLRPLPHPSHMSIDEAIAVAREIGSPRTLLTHLTHLNDHAELAAALPPGVEPAFDGLRLQL